MPAIPSQVFCSGVALHRCFVSCKNMYFPAAGPFTQKKSALSASRFFPLFCFSGTHWTLLELPAGAGTCGELGFVTTGGLRNKCLDIHL